MLAGALLMMLRAIPWRKSVQQARKHPKTASLLCAVIAACFFCVHHFMPILHSDTLVPALQSPWFKPHIIAYMLAYTLMASAAVIALTSHLSPLTSIVFVGISLITIGMLFGALWVLLISFVLLQMCWWGINYLPSAQGSSVHVYRK